MSPTENVIVEGTLKESGPEALNMSAIKDNGMGEKSLVLTPRRVSGREKKSISYNKLHTGAADSDDEDLSAKENALGGSMSKGKLGRDQRQKLPLQEITKKVKTLFDNMKNHPHAGLFNQNLSAQHPIYDEIKSNFIILNLIVLNFSLSGHYKNTDEIADDFRKMIITRTKMNAFQAGSSRESEHIQQFHTYFEDQFKELGLEGLSLTKQPDSAPLVTKNGKVEQKPQQKIAPQKKPVIADKPKPNQSKP